MRFETIKGQLIREEITNRNANELDVAPDGAYSSCLAGKDPLGAGGG